MIVRGSHFWDFNSLQELPETSPPGQLPRSTEIILEDDLVDSCKPGDRISLVGVYKAIAPRAQGAISGNFRAMILANSVKQLGRDTSMHLGLLSVNSSLTNPPWMAHTVSMQTRFLLSRACRRWLKSQSKIISHVLKHDFTCSNHVGALGILNASMQDHEPLVICRCIKNHSTRHQEYWKAGIRTRCTGSVGKFSCPIDLWTQSHQAWPAHASARRWNAQGFCSLFWVIAHTPSIPHAASAVISTSSFKLATKSKGSLAYLPHSLPHC